MLDAADDVFAAALAYLNSIPNTKEQVDLEKAADLLTKIRPFVRKFHSSEYLNALASGEICLVLGYSGDVKQAQKRAAEAKSGIEIAYAIPKEGAQLWFDDLAIPKDAKNVAEAHALIDYLLRPDVAAKNSNVISYANGNAASRALIDKAIIEDKTVYPDDATMKTFYTIQSHDQKTQRLMNRLWTRIKTGAVTRDLILRSGAQDEGLSGRNLPPSPVQPEPLLRMLAHPTFDDAGDDLHRALDVDLAVGVARGRDLVGQFAPERVAVSLAHDAHAADRRARWRASCAISGLALAQRPKNTTSTPFTIVLVDQHADCSPRSSAWRGAPAHRARSGSGCPCSPRASSTIASRRRRYSGGDRAGWSGLVVGGASAGTSQLARCAAKTSVGLPESRIARKRSNAISS